MPPELAGGGYAAWAASAARAVAAGDADHAVFTTPLAATRAAALAAIGAAPAVERPRLVANHQLCRPAAGPAKIQAPTTPEGLVLRFVRLMTHLAAAPWASMSFDPNTGILNKMIAAHMSIITGQSKNDRALYTLIDPSPTAQLANTQNLVWITNRCANHNCRAAALRLQSPRSRYAAAL
jgi:hypothetical protein